MKRDPPFHVFQAGKDMSVKVSDNTVKILKKYYEPKDSENKDATGE